MFVDPKTISIAHATLAQLCFGIVVAVSVLSRTVGQALPPANPDMLEKLAGESACPTKRSSAPLIAAIALLSQTGLGAAVRHHAVSIIPHIVGAAVSTALVMWAGLEILIRNMAKQLPHGPDVRAVWVTFALTFSQIFLGLAAYMSRIATADEAQPIPLMVGLTVAHVAAGSLAFGAAVALALIVYRDALPANAALAPGGMAVA
jgi:hypothetical protein